MIKTLFWMEKNIAKTKNKKIIIEVVKVAGKVNEKRWTTWEGRGKYSEKHSRNHWLVHRSLVVANESTWNKKRIYTKKNFWPSIAIQLNERFIISSYYLFILFLFCDQIKTRRKETKIKRKFKCGETKYFSYSLCFDDYFRLVLVFILTFYVFLLFSVFFVLHFFECNVTKLIFKYIRRFELIWIENSFDRPQTVDGISPSLKLQRSEFVQCFSEIKGKARKELSLHCWII